MERRPTSSRCVSGKQLEISKGEQMVLGMHKVKMTKIYTHYLCTCI